MPNPALPEDFYRGVLPLATHRCPVCGAVLWLGGAPQDAHQEDALSRLLLELRDEHNALVGCG